MRHLLDAHTLIWALDDPSRLGRRARVILENPTNELTVSVVTIWELSNPQAGRAIHGPVLPSPAQPGRTDAVAVA